MRILAAIVIQPHVKNKLTPQKLLPFSWDKKKKTNEIKLTPEQQREKFNKIIAKLGETY